MNVNDPRLYIFTAALLALLFSVYIFFFTYHPGSMLLGLYVGLWVPSLLSGFNLFYKHKNDNGTSNDS